MAQLLNFVVKDAISIRDDVLRTIKNGLIRRGVETPNVSPGSDWFVLATALGNELAVVGANAVIKADEQMPDSAGGDGLARIAAVLGLEKQPAAGSVGFAIIAASATSPVPTGQELLDANGQRFRVTVGGNYANGDSVPIEAVDVGAATNKAPGEVLRWKVSPPFCDEKVTVAAGGLVNGIDAEDDEALRARVLAVFQNPPGSGNWEHCAELAEEADARVQKAFVHPAALGPSTMRIAVTAAPTLSSKARDVASTVLSSVVEPYVQGKLPEHAHVEVTTVDNVEATVAFALALPEAPTANPPGPGGGWINATPWPAPNGVSAFRAAVTSVTSSTELEVDAVLAPVPGVSRIAWLSPVDWKLYTALVTSFSGSSGAYTITLDTPFAGITVGCLLWPECQNALAYCETVLAQFALMGPGEVTSNASALLRGFRHPPPANGWPSALAPHLLNAVTRAHDEVLAAQFLYREAPSHGPLTGSAGQLAPNVPASISDPPLIFVPKHIAFYRIQ
jgi:uncharacterized phage protein gp47/JayE